MFEKIENCCGDQSKDPFTYLQHLHIVHPDLKNKTSTSITFQDYWEGLLDLSKEWNIKDRISSNRITSCPPSPDSLSHTVGSRNLPTENLDDLGKWYMKIRGHLIELDVYQYLQEQLINECGTVFIGYNTNTYLSLFTGNYESGAQSFEISEYWENLAFLKGLNIKSIKESPDCKKLIKFIQDHLTKATSLKDFIDTVKSKKFDRKSKIKYLEKVIAKVSSFLEVQIKGKPTETFEQLAKEITDNHLQAGFTKSHIEASGSEKDIFFIFPKRKTLMQIEVKDGKIEKIQPNTRDAMKQIEDMKAWIQKAHGDLFDGWKYVSVVALTQCERQQITDTCSGTNAVFIAKEDMADHLVQWWQKISEALPEIHDQLEYEEGKRKYVEFMKRAIGFIRFTNDIRSSLSKHHEKICQDLTGSKFMAAGSSSSDLVVQEKISLTENLNKVDETKRRYVRAIFWSSHQKKLVEDKALKLLFHSDFGTGKTLIFKATAKEIAKNEDEEVIFITMPRLFYYEGEVTAQQLKLTIFELATIQEFEGTNIKFISDTIWMREGEDISVAQGRFMNFAKEHLNTHFFVDEYRSLNQAHIKNHMNFMKFICAHHIGHWWLAVRLSPLDSSNAAELPIMDYKKLNIELGMLPINLRCTGKIMETGNKIRRELDQYKLRPPNHPAAPLETLPGSLPEIDKTHTEKDLKVAVEKAVSGFNGEPLIIIVDHPQKRVSKPFCDFPDIIENILKKLDIKCARYLLNEVNDVKCTNSFLKEPEGVLLTDIEMFTGMECKNIIYVCGKEMDVDAVLRSVSVLRCVQYTELN